MYFMNHHIVLEQSKRITNRNSSIIKATNCKTKSVKIRKSMRIIELKKHVKIYK